MISIIEAPSSIRAKQELCFISRKGVFEGSNLYKENPVSVRVDLNPILRKMYCPGYDPEQGLILNDATGKTLHQVVISLGIPPDEVSSILVNHRVEQPSYKVQDGDLIHLAVAISGG